LTHPTTPTSRARYLLALLVLTAVAAGVVAARSAADASAQSALPGTWATLAPSGDPRQEVSFTEAGGKLYLFGGTTVEQQEVYDPATGTWRPTSGPGNLEGKLDHVHGVTVGGKIYYIGGLTGWPQPDVGTVHIYDPATGDWTQGAPMGGRSRGGGGVAVHDGKIYYAGGIADGAAVAWLDRYDPATNQWTQLPSMPTARDHFSAAVLEGKLWAIGGRGGPGAIDKPTGVNEAYDIAAGKWSTGHKPLPTLRGGFAAAAIGCEIVIIGGEGGVANNGAHAAVEAYNPATNTWRSLAPMPTPRHGIQAAVLGSDIHIAAGGKSEGGGNTTDVHERLTVGAQPGCPTPPAPTAPTSTTPASGAGGSTPGGSTAPACCGAPAPPQPPSGPAPVQPGIPTPGAPQATDGTAPRIGSVVLSRRRFHAVRSGSRYGTTLRLTLSEAARLELTVRRRSGRRLVRIAGTVRAQRPAGRTSVRFTGRIAGKRLARGRYVLTVVAVDAAGNRSKAVRRSFSILSRPRART